MFAATVGVGADQLRMGGNEVGKVITLERREARTGDECPRFHGRGA